MKIIIISIILLLAGCGSTPEDNVNRELLWYQVLKTYISEAQSGNVSVDMAKKAKASIEIFQVSRQNFLENPDTSACGMSKAIYDIANIISLDIPNVDFCTQPVLDIDQILIEAELEAIGESV